MPFAMVIVFSRVTSSRKAFRTRVYHLVVQLRHSLRLETRKKPCNSWHGFPLSSKLISQGTHGMHIVLYALSGDSKNEISLEWSRC